MGTTISGALAPNKKLDLANTSTLTGAQTDTNLSGASLLGKTSDMNNTQNKTTEVENKNTNIGIIGRGLAALPGSIAKGTTRAIDKITDAPAYINNAIKQKNLEDNSAYTVQMAAKKAAEKYQQKADTHVLGDKVQEWEQKVDAKQEAIVNDNPNSKLAETVYKGTELAESVGAMLPTIAAAAATSGIGGAVVGATTTAGTAAATTAANIVGRAAEAAGLSLMFGNVYSDSIDQSVKQGYDYVSSSNKAFRDALTEVGTELLFGGIAGTGKALVTAQGLGKIADTAGIQSLRKAIGDTAAGRVAIGAAKTLTDFSKTGVGKFLVGDIAEDGLGGILGEAAEEMISEIVGPYNERATTNPEAVNATLGEVLEAGLGGAIISAIFGGAQGIGRKLQDAKVAKTYERWVNNPKETLRRLNDLQNNGGVTEDAKQVLGKVSKDIDVNSFKDQFALPSELKIEMPTNIDSLTDGEAQLVLNDMLPKFASAYRAASNLKAMQAMSGEYQKAVASDDIISKNEAVREAEAQLQQALNTATEQFGAEAVRQGLTTEQNEQLKSQGIDINALNKNLAEAKIKARKSVDSDIAKAIKAGTAEELYGKDIVDKYNANRTVSDAAKKLKAQSKNGTISFGGYLRTTDADGNVSLLNYNQVSQQRFGKNYNKLNKEQQVEIASEFEQQKQAGLAALTEAVNELNVAIANSGNKGFKVAIASDAMLEKYNKKGSNAWWDPDDKTMYLNPNHATTKSSAYSFFAHETLHKVTDALETQDPTGASKRAFYDSIGKAMEYSGYPVNAIIDKTANRYHANYAAQAYRALKKDQPNAIEHLSDCVEQARKSAKAGASKDDINRLASNIYATDKLNGYDITTQKGNVHIDGILEEEVMARFISKMFGSTNLMAELAKVNSTSLEELQNAVKSSGIADVKLNKMLANTRYQILADMNKALAGVTDTKKKAKKEKRSSLAETLNDGTKLSEGQIDFLSYSDPALLDSKGRAKVWYKGRKAYQDTNLANIAYEDKPYTTSFFSDNPSVASSYTLGDHDMNTIARVQENFRVDNLDDVKKFLDNLNNNLIRKDTGEYKLLTREENGETQYAIAIVMPEFANFPMVRFNYTPDVDSVVAYVRDELPKFLAKDITATKPGSITKNIIRADKVYVVDTSTPSGKPGSWDVIKAPEGASYKDYAKYRDGSAMPPTLYDKAGNIIEYTDELLNYSWTTDMLVGWAYDNGYDAVLIKNVLDNNDGFERPGDVLVSINPQGKVKDIANTTPTDHPDTRYSLSDDEMLDDELEFIGEAPETDSFGKVLSLGQREFYADSIGTLDTDGRIIPLISSAFPADNPLTKLGGFYYTRASEGDTNTFYGKMTRPYVIERGSNFSVEDFIPEELIAKGYDGVVIGEDNFMFVDQAQIADTTNRNPLQSYEAMMSLSDDLSDINSEDFAPIDMTGLVNDTAITGVTDERLRQIDELKAKYGAYDKLSIPRKLNSNIATNRTIGRLIDSAQTPNQLRGAMINDLLDGITGHLIMTDDSALNYVNKKMGQYQTLNDAATKTTELFSAGHEVNKYDLALGQQLILDLGNEINRINAYNETVTDPTQKKSVDGLVDMTEDLIAKVCAAGTRAGQNLQAMALIKKMTPQGRLYYIEAQVDQYISEMVDRRGNSRVGGFKLKQDADGNFVPITISEELRAKMLQCTSVEELNAVEEEIATEIAQQIPATLTDRIVAWRYLSMLGNPRTHVRNIVSNLAMGKLVATKDAIKGAIEDTVFKDAKAGRTATNKKIAPETKKAYQDLAIEDWDKNGVSDEALNGGKVGFQSLINEKRNKFGSSGFAKAVDKINKLNSNGVKEGTLAGGLEGEDFWSGKKAYVQAFTKYCAANNLDTAYLRSGTLNANTALAQARSYAVNEAAKATYHDANNLAMHLNQIEKQNGTIGRIIVGGLVPFKKTPGNILKRGVEYSPIGLAQGMVDLYKASRTTVEDYKGEYSALNSTDALDLNKSTLRFDAEAKRTRAICDAIDRLASGLTGTGILMLGFILGNMGFLKGNGSDNDREEYYDQMLGNQQYSITIAGKNYTLDWLTPACMPLFAGVAVSDMFEGDMDLSAGDILDGLSKIADPVMNLSVLQGINDALGSYDSGLGKVVLSAAEGYVGQMVPTLAGQIARTIDPIRRTTYAPTNDENASSKEINTFVNRMLNKIPFASQKNQEYIDMWGRTESRGDSLIGRAFSQSVAPWYQKDIVKTAADDVVAQVYEATGDRAVIPTSPESSYTFDNETYHLSEKDYHDTKETVGQISYVGVTTLAQVPGFSQLSSEQQADLLSAVYSFARKVGKSDYATAYGISYDEDSSTARIKAAVAAGMTIGEAIYVNYMANNLTADKNEKGKTINGSKKAKVINLYKALGLTEAQMKAISIYDL